MYEDRIELYRQLEKARQSKVISYITGDRPGQETQIHSEVISYFVEHLDSIGVQNKISLFLYTQGGATLAGWNIVNLIKQFCEELEVIVPFKSHSTGTLICLGADKILMTKQATLSPIDPSVNTPLNPQIPNGQPMAKAPVSVEAIKGFLGLATKELKIRNDNASAAVLSRLSEMVHPLVLGEVYRARTQIQMLAHKLLCKQIKNPFQIRKIINFLCSDSGSHDYTINRREALKLGLPVIKPDEELYIKIKSIFDDINSELELTSRFDPNILLGPNSTCNYGCTKGIIESISGGCHALVSEGNLTRVTVPTAMGPQVGIQDDRTFEGWRRIR